MSISSTILKLQSGQDFVQKGLLTKFKGKSLIKYKVKSYVILCSERRPISMTFHKDILMFCLVKERTRFCHRNCCLQSSKGHTIKYTSKCYVSININISIKFHKDILTVVKAQSELDFVTERLTGRPTDRFMWRKLLPTKFKGPKLKHK